MSFIMLDAFENPLNVIDELYRSRKQQFGGRNKVDLANLGERLLFETILQRQDSFVDSIPLISDTNISANQSRLFRFRGLIQDVWNPEIYCGVYASGRADESDIILKYRDVTDENYDDNQSLSPIQLCERSASKLLNRFG